MYRRFAIIVTLASAVGGCRARRDGSLSAPEAAVYDRKIIGPAQDLQATDLDAAKLQGSLSARRDHGWSVLTRALAPTPTAGNANVAIPLWQTWYDTDEFRLMFRSFYAKARKLPGGAAAATTEALGDLADQVMQTYPNIALPPDLERKMQTRLSQIQSEAQAGGLNGPRTGVTGKGIVFYSPAMIRHVLISFREMLGCYDRYADSPAPVKNAELTQRRFGACFAAPFPAGAAAVKTTWVPTSRVIGHFDTGVDGLAKMLDGGTWRAAETLKFDAIADDRQPYTIKTEVGTEYKLAAMHVTTREVPEWVWVSLWWSPDGATDFGSDRPPAADALRGAWSNYKMCTVTAFTEGDPLTDDTLGGFDPALAKAYRGASQALGGAPFCSNPFLEIDDGMGKSNCAGCHQFAAPRRAFDLGTHLRYAEESNDFLADFLWSYDAKFASVMAGEKHRIDASSP